MYAKYAGVELYEKIDHLVEKAFHIIYTYNEMNYYSIEDITLDYRTVEEEDDFPLITVDILIHNDYDGDNKVSIEYFLDKSDEFNIGVFYKSMIDVLDE